jgi:hypothetical protein
MEWNLKKSQYSDCACHGFTPKVLLGVEIVF